MSISEELACGLLGWAGMGGESVQGKGLELLRRHVYSHGRN